MVFSVNFWFSWWMFLSISWMSIIKLNIKILTSFCIKLSLLLKLFKTVFILSFNGFLHLSLFDLYVILLLLYDFEYLIALIPPVMQFSLILYPLLICIIHDIPGFLQLRYLNLVLWDLLFTPLLDVFDLTFELIDNFIVVFFILFF